MRTAIETYDRHCVECDKITPHILLPSKSNDKSNRRGFGFIGMLSSLLEESDQQEEFECCTCAEKH